jgi:Ran GTPase-activating protein (RanGAP) involved in mRNA processing and transport
LRHNGIGDSGVKAIAGAIIEAARLRANANSPLMSGQRSFVSPGLLDDARYEPHCLRALLLGFNGISAVGAQSLSEALSAAVRAARVSLGDEAAKDAPCVRELDLACNSIGSDGAKALATALDGVEELDLGNNGIGDGGIKWLAKALKENTILRRLIVSGNNVTAEGSYWVAESLSTNQDLRHLDLGSNGIGDAGAKDIAEDLRDNTGLHSLILRRNGIGDEGALELCSALDPRGGDMQRQKTNAYLTELSLRGNLISDRASIEVKRRVGLRMDVEMQQRF